MARERTLKDINWPLGTTNEESLIMYKGFAEAMYCGKSATAEDIEEFKKWLIENDYKVVHVVQ